MATIETVRPGVQFTPDAAAAFRRADAQVFDEFGRNIDVNSTYRSREQQLAMYNAWQWHLRGGPHPGHSKALHPDDPLAFHVTGEALDSDDWRNARIAQILADNGFIRNRLYVKNEEHHFEYIRSRDNHHDQTPPAISKESEDMDFINIQGKSGSHRAGQFAIYRKNSDGTLVAKRLTYDTLNPSLPTFDNEALTELRKAMPFLDL